ncbi:MAG: hypothetical protein GY950_34025, partial [bacterium]|nr:hypothetical protein [bacterium]
MSKTVTNSNMSYGSFFATVLMVFFMVVIFGTGYLAAQSATGTWLESRFNIKLELFDNGTYRIHHSNQVGQGRYSVNGNNFCLYDQSGTGTVCYTVTGYNATRMVLRDVNGVVMDFSRQQSTPSQPQQTAPLPSSGPRPGDKTRNVPPGQVLAQKGQFTLTGEHFNIGIGLTQFIIGQAVKPSEKEELKAKL